MAPPDAARYLPRTANTQGTCTDRFTAVREALAASLDDKDVGASVAVYVDGEPEVDLWGGYADIDRTVPWERDTLTHVWSTTKTMTALCVLMLADRGALDLHAPVATYWPEFAAAGKEDARVSHVLSRTAGLPRFEAPPRWRTCTTGRPSPHGWPGGRRPGNPAPRPATTR